MSGYRRFVSFPSMSSTVRRSRTITQRSLSLPVRFHPIVFQMNNDVSGLTTWSRCFVHCPPPALLNEGLQRIATVLSSLLLLLNHPLAIARLGESLTSTESISKDLLRLVDSHDSFRVLLINLHQLQAETQAALRREDSSGVAASIHAQKQVARDIEVLAKAAERAVRTIPDMASENTLPIALTNAMFALVSASAHIFRGLAVLSDESTMQAAPMSTEQPDTVKPVRCLEIKMIVDVIKARLNRKKEPAKEVDTELDIGYVAMQKFKVLEQCIDAMEISSEKVCRDVVTARVYLLNIISSSS